MLNTMQRLVLVNSLHKAVVERKKSHDEDYFRLSGDIVSIRNTLLGRIPQRIDMIDLDTSVSDMVAAISLSLSEAMAFPTDEKYLAGRYAREFLDGRWTDNDGDRASLHTLNHVLTRIAVKSNLTEVQNMAFNRFSKGGEEAYEDANNVKAIIAGAEERRTLADVILERKTLEEEITRRTYLVQIEVNKIEIAIRDSKIDAKEGHKQREKVIREHDYDMGKLRTDHEIEKYNRNEDIEKNVIGGYGNKVISRLLERSTITKEAAKEWSEKQNISTAALARLSKLKYSKTQFRADMAEFYQLTNGRVPHVSIDTKGDRRANAISGIGNEIGTVMLGSNFCKKALFHELAHHLEDDYAARFAAQGYLEKRKKSNTLVTLLELTLNPGYGPEEVAWEDDFFDPYVGKYYQNGTTEVFSMGIESFAEPEVLARRMAHDPEIFAMLFGYLKTPPTPMENVAKNLKNSLITENSAREEADANLRTKLITLMGANIEITKGTPKLNERIMREINVDKYIGSHGIYDIYKEKIKVFKSERKVPGFKMFRHLEGFPSDSYYQAGTLDILKARIAIMKATWGSSPYNPNDMNTTALAEMLTKIQGE